MKKRQIIIFTVSAILLAACAPVAGRTSAPLAADTAATISVTGSGQVYVVPDTASINVGVRTQSGTVKGAIDENNAQASAIKSALVEQGVAEKDIQTASFNVYQQSDYDFEGNPTINYYVVENNVYVTVREMASLSDILGVVADSGANNIYGVSFDVQDKSEAQKTARALAVKTGMAQAEELAATADVELGALLSITSGSTTTNMSYGYGMGGGAMMESVPISSGQMPIGAQVTLTYAIK